MPPDIEMNLLSGKEDSLTQGSTWSMRENGNGTRVPRHTPAAPFDRWIEGFRRDPTRRFTPKDAINQLSDGTIAGAGGGDMDLLAARERRGGHYFDLHAANVGTASTNLARELKGRHLQMIAIGGSIGGFCRSLLYIRFLSLIILIFCLGGIFLGIPPNPLRRPARIWRLSNMWRGATMRRSVASPGRSLSLF